ncbi:hypothetical protein L596_019760 [Steinernema carpocapsae]|uniref:Uncharacterized protein n=1 Tax=Steinernema carpocapsae TaxID=34508 RepID=A0A4U5MRI1_STECR|nr:hypothetical protein L596_019760 [Steinernema carpocapsae]
MLRILAIAEHALTGLFCLSAIVGLLLILKRKSIFRIWNESPPVLMLLLSILLLSLVGVAMALGWILFALNLIQNSSVTTVVLHLIGVTGISINKFTNCLFYTRVVLEISPYLVDIILASTTKIELGSYIGPYGALGQSADMFVCTFVYFYMTTKHRRDGGGSH